MYEENGERFWMELMFIFVGHMSETFENFELCAVECHPQLMPRVIVLDNSMDSRDDGVVGVVQENNEKQVDVVSNVLKGYSEVISGKGKDIQGDCDSAYSTTN
ncbi:hypothetical protein Salat_1214200 [Sesamum alatum]|uniref:Uncharacterized protein n=1 Tax=Sesamum alatum TaxID=300844 RepID=A0AAE2CNX3_9LAMI|nr:hypothetical protein Salat_1214200 [Sesamum alatum]